MILSGKSGPWKLPKKAGRTDRHDPESWDALKRYPCPSQRKSSPPFHIQLFQKTTCLVNQLIKELVNQ
jgi:hypothetical protein